MTDDTAWHAPGAGAQQPAPPIGTTPPPEGPTGAQPPPGYYVPQQPHPGAGYGWTPPPKPGLIPLQPLAFGTLLGASFKVLRRNPRPTFGVALLLQSAAVILSLVLIGIFTFAATSRISSATSDDEAAIVAGSVGIGVVTVLLTMFFSIVASAMLQGIIVVEVARGALGEKLPLRKIWGFAKGRIWALVGWAAIISAIILLAVGLITGLVILMVSTMGVVGTVLAVIFAILAMMGAAVLGAWLSTKLSMVPSALVLEQISLRSAIARSWSLTHGHFWRVFGIQLLVNTILSAATQIAIVPFSFIFGILMALVDPTGTGDNTAMVWAIITYVVMIMVTVVLATITSVVMTANSSLLYLDLRMRKEGLDLELTRFVETRHAGANGNANPYLRATEPAAANTSGYTFV